MHAHRRKLPGTQMLRFAQHDTGKKSPAKISRVQQNRAQGPDGGARRE
jgi:hypothetical protein